MSSDGADSATRVQQVTTPGLEVGPHAPEQYSGYLQARRDQQSIMRQVDHLHEIRNYVCQHLLVASNRMKTWYDKLANCAGYQEGESVRLCRPTHTKGKSSKLQLPLECPYMIITRINDVVYRIQRKPTSMMIVVRLDQLAQTALRRKPRERLKIKNRDNLETAERRQWAPRETRHDDTPSALNTGMMERPFVRNQENRASAVTASYRER
jgi:hypothetical protein